MSKEILSMVGVLSDEKGVDSEVIFEAIEAALAMATQKRAEADITARVKIDRKTGDYETFRIWTILDDNDASYESREKHIFITDAEEIDANLKVGDTIEEPMESVDFGRIGTQTARQVISQKVREAERAKIVNDYSGRVNELFTGVVKRSTRDRVLLDLGSNVEAVITKEHLLPRESFRVGDRVRGILMEARHEARGPQLFLSRTTPEMLIALFKVEVPEIGEDLIELKSAARDPGSRSKIAVKTNDGRIDPIGACVGMRGSRVQAVSSELGGERIDIVMWDDDPVQLIINAMAPAEVDSILVDEEKHTIDIVVKEEQLPQAIGRNGQNIRLATELTGWTLNIMTEEQATEASSAEAERVITLFIEKLQVERDVAEALVEEDFTSIEEIAYVPVQEMLNIEGFDEEIVEELRSRAKDALLMMELINEEKLSDAEPAEDLLALEGMTKHLAYLLASRGIISQEDLAEQAIDDLLDIEELNKAQAAALIMAARAPWFAAADDE